jgi:hypothetical protein
VAPTAGTRATERADVAAAALSLALFAYTALRAWLVPLTHDEALTYLGFVRAPWSDILAFRGPYPTNNHLLNTVLVKLCVAVLGVSESTQRLPNVLAHAAYLYFGWRILRRNAPPLAALAGFVLLTTNPFVLEFFALSRGYGLSLGFAMAGLSELSRSFARFDARAEARGLALVGLGIVASLPLVFLLAGAAAAALVLRARDETPRGARGTSAEHVPLIAVCALAALFVLPVVWHVRAELHFGGRLGFWRDSVGSLVWCTLYGTRHGWPLVAALGLLGAVFGARTRADMGQPIVPTSVVAGVLLVGIGVGVSEMAAHVLFGTLFLTGRMAVFHVPLAVLGGVLVLVALLPHPRWGAAARCLLFCAAALSAGHLLRCANLRASYLWWFDADDLEAMALVDTYRSDRALRLGVSWFCQPGLEYYRVTRGMAWLAPLTREPPSAGDDLAFVIAADRPVVERLGFRLVREFPRSGGSLWENPALSSRPDRGARPR